MSGRLDGGDPRALQQATAAWGERKGSKLSSVEMELQNVRGKSSGAAGRSFGGGIKRRSR